MSQNSFARFGKTLSKGSLVDAEFKGKWFKAKVLENIVQSWHGMVDVELIGIPCCSCEAIPTVNLAPYGSHKYQYYSFNPISDYYDKNIYHFSENRDKFWSEHHSKLNIQLNEFFGEIQKVFEFQGHSNSHGNVSNPHMWPSLGEFEIDVISHCMHSDPCFLESIVALPVIDQSVPVPVDWMSDFEFWMSKRSIFLTTRVFVKTTNVFSSHDVRALRMQLLRLSTMAQKTIVTSHLFNKKRDDISEFCNIYCHQDQIKGQQQLQNRHIDQQNAEFLMAFDQIRFKCERALEEMQMDPMASFEPHLQRNEYMDRFVPLQSFSFNAEKSFYPLSARLKPLISRVPLDSRSLRKTFSALFSKLYQYRLKFQFFISPSVIECSSKCGPLKNLSQLPLHFLMKLLYPLEVSPLCLRLNEQPSIVRPIKIDRFLNEMLDYSRPVEVKSIQETNHRSELLVTLRDYQVEAVRFMYEREQSANHTLFWIKLSRPLNNQEPCYFFYSPYFNSFCFHDLPLTRGGWNLQSMGLGKTIVSLALINHYPVLSPNEILHDQLCAKGIAYAFKTTLIVTHVSLEGQWMNEIQSKSKKPLKVLHYYGPKRPKSVEALLQYDVILTSYGTLVSDWSSHKNKLKNDQSHAPWEFAGPFALKYRSPLHRIFFKRIILDEAHCIRNASSVTCKSALDLLGECKWMLTGTPITSSFRELETQTQFLNVQGMSKEFWNHVMENLVTHRAPDNDVARWGQRMDNWYRALHQLSSQMMFRQVPEQSYNGRLKLLELPTSEVHVVHLKLSEAQEKLYTLLWNHVQTRYKRFKEKGLVTAKCIECMQLLLGVRQMCSFTTMLESDLKLQIEEENKGDTSKWTEHDARSNVKLGQVNSMSIADVVAFQQLDSDCPICLDLLQDPVQSLCRHLFCLECINAFFNTIRNQKCPMCRSPMLLSQFRKPNKKLKHPDCAQNDSDAQDPEDEIMKDQSYDIDNSSNDTIHDNLRTTKKIKTQVSQVECVVFDAKVKYVMTQLLDLKVQQSKDKVLIFTQFNSTLLELKRQFKTYDISFTSIEGSMNMNKRESNLQRFQEDPSQTVMLLSLRSGAIGLTLTRANRIYFMDPTINPSQRAQAIARVCRLGQQSCVQIYDLLMQNTVESTLYDIVQQKKCSSDSKSNTLLTLAEIETIFCHRSISN